jgi:hypothetical protein
LDEKAEKTPPTRLTVALTGLFIWIPFAAVCAIVNPEQEPAGKAIEVGLIIVLSLAAFAAIVVFASHALSNHALSPSERREWALLLIFVWPSAAWYWATERRRGRDSLGLAP